MKPIIDEMLEIIASLKLIENISGDDSHRPNWNNKTA